MVSKVVAVTYPVCAVVVVLFGLFACVFMFIRQRRNAKKDDTEFFLTARRSVGWFRIGFSFYAAAMGSWTLFSPPSYGYYAGTLGLAMYAVSSGFPVLMIAFLGGFVHKLVPNVLSFTDYVRRRFGPVVQIYVSLLMLFNMGVALTAEFTAVGDLFEYVIGSVRWPIVVIIGIVSAIYTAYGGLYVSIITDQVQAFCAIFMILVLVIFVAVTFKAPLPKPMPAYLRTTYEGYSSIAVMPISLASSTIYSEAMWQRCWATTTKRNLRIGGLVGFVAITVCVFLFGFGGILAAWSGLFKPSGPDDYGNTILFSLLDNVNGGRHIIITVVVSILSVTMSTSAVDSLQNAIVDNISGVYMQHAPLIYVRLLVLALTVPPLVVSLKSYNIIQLFLVANLITTTSTLPVLAGLIRHRWAYYLVTPFSMMMGCAQGLISLFWWSVLDQQSGETYSQTLKRVFTVEYNWPPFLIALGMSVVGIFFGAALEHAFRAMIRRPHDGVDPLEDEQLPLGTVKGDDVSSEEAYEKPVQTGFEPKFAPIASDDVRA